MFRGRIVDALKRTRIVVAMIKFLRRIFWRSRWLLLRGRRGGLDYIGAAVGWRSLALFRSQWTRFVVFRTSEIRRRRARRTPRWMARTMHLLAISLLRCGRSMLSRAKSTYCRLWGEVFHDNIKIPERCVFWWLCHVGLPIFFQIVSFQILNGSFLKMYR